MSSPTLPTKRQTATHGVFRKLHAVTKPVARKQRVAATAEAEDLGGDVPGMGVSSVLMIILGIHVVVIGGLFFHHRFLENHGAIKAAAAEAREQTPVSALAPAASVAPVANREILPMIAAGEPKHRVVRGDNYELIAKHYQIDENDLRAANNNIAIRAGMELRLPPKKIVAVPPAELTSLKSNSAAKPPVSDAGLVEVARADADAKTNDRASSVLPKAAQVKNETKSEVKTAVRTNAVATTTRKLAVAKADAGAPPKALPVKEKTAPAKTAAQAARRSYTVKSGDNIYRIASRLNVDQKALMKANGISDPSKLRAGAQLVIPN